MPPINETGEIEEDLGLTPATTPIADPDTSGNTPDNDAQQSGGQQDETTADEPKSMADAIAQALATDEAKTEGDADPDESKPEDKKAEDGAAKTPDTDKSKEPAEGSADTDDDPSEDELKAYQPKVQKRIKKLLSQRNEARREVEGYRDDATHYRNIRSFMEQSQLADGEVAELFEVGRLLKSNDVAAYEKALDIVLPIAQQLLEATGRSLPKDLREKVENGEFTEDAARDLAVQRARAMTAERRVQQVTQRTQAQEQAQQTSANQTAIQMAVASWTERVKVSDPDFGLKADAMRDAALALIAEKGRPKNAEEAVRYAEEAHRRVSSWFSRAQPQRPASRPAPNAGQSGNRSTLSPEPKSLKDAIFGALKSGT